MNMWAIQDVATGEWWNGTKWHSHAAPWKSAPIDLAGSVVFSPESDVFRATASIVPAPPPEMTDSEAWEWFRTSYLYLHGGRDTFYVNRHIASSECEAYAKGISPEDAFRAARKRKEKEQNITVNGIHPDDCVYFKEIMNGTRTIRDNAGWLYNFAQKLIELSKNQQQTVALLRGGSK